MTRVDEDEDEEEEREEMTEGGTETFVSQSGYGRS